MLDQSATFQTGFFTRNIYLDDAYWFLLVLVIVAISFSVRFFIWRKAQEKKSTMNTIRLLGKSIWDCCWIQPVITLFFYLSKFSFSTVSIFKNIEFSFLISIFLFWPCLVGALLGAVLYRFDKRASIARQILLSFLWCLVLICQIFYVRSIDWH
jgi:hypothetical protein